MGRQRAVDFWAVTLAPVGLLPCAISCKRATSASLVGSEEAASLVRESKFAFGHAALGEEAHKLAWMKAALPVPWQRGTAGRIVRRPSLHRGAA